MSDKMSDVWLVMAAVLGGPRSRTGRSRLRSGRSWMARVRVRPYEKSWDRIAYVRSICSVV